MTRLAVGLMVLAFGLLALGIYRAVTAAQSQPVVPCVLVQEKDRLIQLAHEAIDEAYKDQVKSLFGVWVRDPADQPRRAVSGMQVNLSAYHRARANIRAWEPVICAPP
jgi:hypothetical protein